MTEVFDAEISIDAPPEKVFDHFARPEMMVRWMGEYARLEAVAAPGGEPGPYPWAKL